MQTLDLRSSLLSGMRACSSIMLIVSSFNLVDIDRIGMLTQLKQEIEAHNNNDQELDYLAQIKTKMSSRVSNYETTFSGSIFPQSLLV